jgi:hypothetical protein
MAKLTPKQRVSNNDNSEGWKSRALDVKRAIVNDIAEVLEPNAGESVSEMKARLLGEDGSGSVSNKKLEKLQRVANRLRSDFDGKKENIINALLETRKGKSGKTDEHYRRHLDKKSIATLLLTFDHAKKKGNL